MSGPAGSQASAPLRPGGTGDRRALTVGGRTWSYQQFADLVRLEVSRAGTTDRHPMTASGLPVVTALATVFAAAAKGVPVIVGDPAGPVPALGPLPADTFLVAVTSGTSGRPRAVLRTASSWLESFAPFSELTGIRPADRVLLTGPLHATLHLFAAVHTLAIGAELTDRPEDATAVHAVPAVLADLLARLPDSAPLRTAVVAGTALSAEIADHALDRGISVTEYYGAAELSFVAARRVPEPLREFPGAQVELRDGTLWVRSPYLALGYPAGTTGPFHRGDDGFATVGDLAEPMAGDGLLIRGRGDAAITTGGATVIAEDVEAALATLPGVAAAAVVGVPNARLGQVVTAVIEPSAGADLGTLRSGARRLLRGQSLPRRWFLTDRLPRTPGGKIDRHTVALATAAAVVGEPAGTPHPAPADGSDSTPEHVSGASLRLRPLP